MSRTPKPWYWKQQRVWCAYINGNKVVLGRDRTEPHRKFHELMAAEPAHVASDSVAAIIDTFLTHIKDGGEASAGTARWYEGQLQSFWEYLKANGHRALTGAQFKPHHVQSWLDSHKDWSGATKNGDARAVKRAFRWAETQEYIARSPLARWKAPKASIRNTYVSEADHLAIPALVTDEPFRDLPTVAWETDARPQELVRIEARRVDVAYRRVVFTLSEGKKERRRVIYLPDKSFAIVKRRMEAYPEGPVLRSTRGGAVDGLRDQLPVHPDREEAGAEVLPDGVPPRIRNSLVEKDRRSDHCGTHGACGPLDAQTGLRKGGPESRLHARQGEAG